MEQDNAQLIQTYKQDLVMYEKQLGQQIQQCKAALQNGSHIEIYDRRCEISCEKHLPVKPVLDAASFTPNKTPLHHLELALGKIDISNQASTHQDRSDRTFSCHKPSSSSQQSESKGEKDEAMNKLLSQTKVLDTCVSPVNFMTACPTTDGQVWTSYNSCTLTLVDRKGKVIQQVKHNTDIKDISLSPTTSTLWVCSSDIMELVSEQLTHRFSTKEKPMCLCVTASNHVIVGMTNNISKFTTQGQMVLTTSATGTGMPLVCTPWRIAECPVTHNVAVVDRNYKGDGGDNTPHVIVMDTDFQKLFVYRADIPYTSQKEAQPFDPWGVVFDSVGNIVVADLDNNSVLLIGGRGEFLKIIHTDRYSACAVGIDKEDVLWAGFCGGNFKLLQYSSV